MGDWDRMFGCGYDAEDLIKSINRSNREEERERYRDLTEQYEENQTYIPTLRLPPIKRRFITFQEAASWAKSNPGKTIRRDPNGDGFIEK